ASARSALEHPSAPVRAWAIRLLGDRKQLPDSIASAVLRLAATESNAEVRCQMASTARRLPARQALPLVSALLRRDADAGDPFIPLLCWFPLESCCDANRDQVLAVCNGTGAGHESRAWWHSGLARQHILPRLLRR